MKKQTKAGSAVLALVLILCVLLCACSGAQGSESAVSPVESSAAVSPEDISSAASEDISQQQSDPDPAESTQETGNSYAELPETEGLLYELNETGDGYIVVGPGTFDGADLVIPAEHDGLPVVKIGDAAFMRAVCAEVEFELLTVTVPDSVQVIGEMAFSDFYTVRSLTLGSGTTRILAGAFQNCPIEAIHIKDLASWMNIEFGSNWSGNIAYDLYENGTLVTAASFSEGTTAVKARVFEGCKSVTEINIPSSVTSIGADAFAGTGYALDEDHWENGLLYADNCLIGRKDTVKSAVVKDGTRIIADEVFGKPYGICDIADAVIPGSVKSINKWAFVLCDSLGSITIGDGVEIIGMQAFSYCGSLEEIVIPSSVKTISESAFNGSALKEVTIGIGVTSIGAGAFEDCGIEKVNYAGSEAQWKAIAIDAKGNENLLNAKMTYNHGQ